VRGFRYVRQSFENGFLGEVGVLQLMHEQELSGIFSLWFTPGGVR
jgi:hypothetical protein